MFIFDNETLLKNTNKTGIGKNNNKPNMKVTGFSFIRNAVIYDYPIIEAIGSILPLCDDLVIAVGNSDDETLDLIGSINNPKIRIVETIWDDSLREGGKVLSIETNKAFNEIADDSDWCFYIQGDEVVHEKYLDIIYECMKRWKDDKKVDGLLFNYLHFYGSYDYVGSSSRWYRKEIRIVRNNKNIYSHGDAQGFRKFDNQKLNVKPIDACIYHYGWVKHPKAMQMKQETFHKHWHDDEWLDKNIIKSEEFDYSGIDALEKFTGTHPKVMEERIKKQNWHFDHDISFNKYTAKDKIKFLTEKLFGFRLGEYRNYKQI